jgi:hypothetical protein
VTAGHCTFGRRSEQRARRRTTARTPTRPKAASAGNDVWVSFAAAPNYSILPPSSTFATQAARYAAWSAALNASSEWHRGTATPHPQYDDLAFFLHDAGVVELDDTVSMSKYGALAPLDYLDRYAKQSSNHAVEAVGYGLEKVTGKADFGGDTRRKGSPVIQTLRSSPPDTYVILSANASSGGTCFGDSGGPEFDTTTSNLVVTVTSFGLNNNCAASGGGYRLDQPDDQAFLASFGIHP